MEKHFEILAMAANKELPETIDDKCGLPLDVITELVEAGYLKAVDASTMEGPAYLNTSITFSGRQYLNSIKVEEKTTEMKVNPNIRLFICHSSADEDLVEKLLVLIRSALNISAQQIRCTSIDGYRLPVGADTNERLRQEVHGADVLIGIISQHSLNSLYVAFELGARWGARKPLFPVLAPGTNPSIMEEPLSGLNALSAANRSQMHQLISDLADVLGIQSEEPAVYERFLESLLELANKAKETPNIDDSEIISSIPPKCIEVMKIISTMGDYKLTSNDISKLLGENLTKTRYFIDQLLNREFIHDSLSYTGPTTYGLLPLGIAYLVEHRLV